MGLHDHHIFIHGEKNTSNIQFKSVQGKVGIFEGGEYNDQVDQTLKGLDIYIMASFRYNTLHPLLPPKSGKIIINNNVRTVDLASNIKT